MYFLNLISHIIMMNVKKKQKNLTQLKGEEQANQEGIEEKRA